MKQKILFFSLLAGAFLSCQQDERLPISFVDETTATVLTSEATDFVASDMLAMVALMGETRISAEEAQQTALFVATQMREVEGIVTKSPLQIASVEVVTNNVRKPYITTKSDEQEQADVYIVNFANNEGYVVTSADGRVPGVLAYNSYGHLGDTITNPGQAILFGYMQDYIEQERENFEKNKEALKIQAEEMIFKQLPKEKQEELIAKGYFNKEGKRIVTKYNSNDKDFESHEEYREWFCSIYGPEAQISFPHPYIGQREDFEKKSREEQEKGYSRYGTWETSYVKPPLLKTLWGQTGDYNDKVLVKCGGSEAPVGCVATAVGQIMAYHKRPATFKGRTMHWNEMTKVDSGDMFSNIYSLGVRRNLIAREDIQFLLARLGDSDLLKMEYGCEGSGANITNAKNTLTMSGYDVTEMGGDIWKAIEQIKNSKPVYVQGCSDKIKNKFLGINIYTSYSGCHAWVIDGTVKMKQPVTTFYVFSCYDDVTTSYEVYSHNEYELVHQNFGWGENDLFLDGSRSKDSKDNTTSGWFSAAVFNNANYNQYGSSGYKSDSDKDYKYKNKMLFIK